MWTLELSQGLKSPFAHSGGGVGCGGIPSPGRPKRELLNFSNFFNISNSEFFFLFLDVYFCVFVAIVQSLSWVQVFVSPWTAACQAFLFFTISQSFFRLISIELVMLFNHLILCLSSFAFSLSQHQGLFQWLSSSHQVAKLSQLQHQSFQWIFRTDFF